jgi:hypothetical protein
MNSEFPPTCTTDIAAYDLAETVAGYVDDSELAPGPNHSPAFRWGWTNRQRDHATKDDGFDALRHRYFRERTSLSSHPSLERSGEHE